jgi:hypothetical protein
MVSELVGNSEDGEQVAAGQPPGTSFLLASRWGGGASAIAFAGKLKIMNSSRFLMELLSTILKSASCVIRVGEFRVLRDSSVYRFANSGFCVMLVGDFKPLRDFRVSRLPIHDSSGNQEAFLHIRSRFNKKIRRTRRG